MCAGPGNGTKSPARERLGGGPFGSGVAVGEPRDPSEGMGGLWAAAERETRSCHGFLAVWPIDPGGLGGNPSSAPREGQGARAALGYRLWASGTPGRSLGHRWQIGTQSDKALAHLEVLDVVHLCIQVWDFKKLPVTEKKKSPNKKLACY